MTTDLLYVISAYQASEAELSCEISYNEQHAIFEGHFPGNPIVPGVCTMQMIGAMLHKALKLPVMLKGASSIKYLQLIIPGMQPTASITWTLAEGVYNVSATLREGAQLLFKMSGSFVDRKSVV